MIFMFVCDNKRQEEIIIVSCHTGAGQTKTIEDIMMILYDMARQITRLLVPAGTYRYNNNYRYYFELIVVLYV